MLGLAVQDDRQAHRSSEHAAVPAEHVVDGLVPCREPYEVGHVPPGIVYRASDDRSVDGQVPVHCQDKVDADQEVLGHVTVRSGNQEKPGGGQEVLARVCQDRPGQHGQVPAYLGTMECYGGEHGQAPVQFDVHGSSTDQALGGNIHDINGYTSVLNVDAPIFQVDGGLHYHGQIADIPEDLLHVQEVQAGGVGHLDIASTHLWGNTPVTGCAAKRSPLKVSCHEPDLPFSEEIDLPDMLGIAPKQVHKVGRLLDLIVDLPVGKFTDKVLPAPEHAMQVNTAFTPDYFVALHNICAAPGVRADGTRYESYTPNHIGARISLPHCKLKLDRWRYHLIGYEHVELCQYLEFGFPLGLTTEVELESKTRNHGSSYMWYSFVDKFVTTEVRECGMSGPFKASPWVNIVVSPMMTAHKKPLARRTVYDASFGPGSLNGATPCDTYMGQPTHYTYPRIEDYRKMVLRAGKGSYMWKVDLSRFYLQLPMDPIEFNKVAVVWRGLFFFFVGLAFGLRHSGLQGQRVTDAVSWILRRLGLESAICQPYSVCNYVDDLGGVEKTKPRASNAFTALRELLTDLGLEENVKKAVPPTREITYLGVQFNSTSMEMSVPPDKLAEIKEEIRRWELKTTINKKELQSLLGKLFWVAKVVHYSRAFMGRLLEQLRSISKVHDKKKIKFSEESRKDIRWWNRYLEDFNGISMIVNEDPIPLSYEQLLDAPHEIMAGDATPTGGGAWHGDEYWSDHLPHHLQDPQLPIHLKEFWVLIVAAKLWGDSWTGRTIVMYCDNDSVVETILKKKPRDTALLNLLREFLYIVVTKKFFPVLRKIDTKKNEIADFLSRRFDEPGAKRIFAKFGLTNMKKVVPRTNLFSFTSNW